MPSDNRDPESNSPNPSDKKRFRFTLWIFLAVAAALIVIPSLVRVGNDPTIEYSAFKQLVEEGTIRRVEMSDSAYVGFTATSEPRTTSDQPIISFKTTPVNDPGFVPLLDERGVEYYAVPVKNSPILSFLLTWILPIVLISLVWRFMFRRMGNAGAGVLSFGKNRSQILAEGDTGVSFTDVAGADESKAELVEVVDFLQHPDRYTAIGGKIPKGVLLVGAPGTGKTLLARAVAGEAGVPFFRMSGADFVEMFVGVGAARVRDLFKQAREKSPCIIFIDELDAIGRSRSSVMGGNDEREQTLNQLLVEMDGFDARTGIIILAATNRPEILDPALMRPGRFDRQVVVDRPDQKGREAILKIHSAGVKMDETVDLTRIARGTPGLVGADLANIINEAALNAVRIERTEVNHEDLEEAVEKVLAGLKKKSKLIDPRERKRVAYHETGHAVVAAFTNGADPVEKISIVPRGFGALGFTMQLPTEERYLLTESELLGKIDVFLGGRATEQVFFGEISTGASDDLNKATEIARRMITDYGMSAKFRNVYLPHQRSAQFLGAENEVLRREYSEKTQSYIDEETARIIDQRYERVMALLQNKRDIVDRVAEELLEKENLNGDAFRDLIENRGSEVTLRLV